MDNKQQSIGVVKNFDKVLSIAQTQLQNNIKVMADGHFTGTSYGDMAAPKTVEQRFNHIYNNS
jgi:hypothetical protein